MVQQIESRLKRKHMGQISFPESKPMEMYRKVEKKDVIFFDFVFVLVCDKMT